MKKTLIYTSLLFFVFALNAKSISFLCKYISNFEWSSDNTMCEDEESGKEEKKSEEENESENFSDKLFQNTTMLSLFNNNNKLHYFNTNIDYSHQFSKTVYSPPEVI